MPKWLENAVFYEIYPQSFATVTGMESVISRELSVNLIILKSLAAMRSG